MRALSEETQVLNLPARASRPKWNGSFLSFDLSDGAQSIPCAMSCAAIEQISRKRCYREQDALAFFASERVAIETLSLEKLRLRAGHECGRLTIWADDTEPPDVGP